MLHAQNGLSHCIEEWRVVIGLKVFPREPEVIPQRRIETNFPESFSIKSEEADAVLLVGIFSNQVIVVTHKFIERVNGFLPDGFHRSAFIEDEKMMNMVFVIGFHAAMILVRE
jgi:hypothetical protein